MMPYIIFSLTREIDKKWDSHITNSMFDFFFRKLNYGLDKI